MATMTEPSWATYRRPHPARVVAFWAGLAAVLVGPVLMFATGWHAADWVAPVGCVVAWGGLLIRRRGMPATMRRMK